MSFDRVAGTAIDDSTAVISFVTRRLSEFWRNEGVFVSLVMTVGRALKPWRFEP
jgi:hypothetical protein